MKKVNFQSRNGQNIMISAVINFRDGFDEGKKYPAVIVAHPGGGVKEQTAGLYAQKLAGNGLVTIAFDASYQGESTGEPRQLGDPYIRTEDVSAVVDCLTTLPYVDPDKIGGMGICAGGGYTANAAINDRRIKAVGTVSAVNIGSMFRNGWDKRPGGYFLDHDARSYELIARVFSGQSKGLTRDDILDNITITWLTNTSLSGARLYWEYWGKGYFNAKGVSIPVAVSVFYNKLDKGGHFAAWEQPQLLSEEVRGLQITAQIVAATNGGARTAPEAELERDRTCCRQNIAGPRNHERRGVSRRSSR